jgi:hypothetical protein
LQKDKDVLDGLAASTSNPNMSDKLRNHSSKLFGSGDNPKLNKLSAMASDLKSDNPLDSKKVLYKIMTNGSYFGEVDIIFRRKRVYDLVTTTDCDLYILSRTEFENIVMNEYPHIFKELHNLAIKREEKDLIMIHDTLKSLIDNDNSPCPDQPLEKIMDSISKKFKDSICTEVENHEIIPLEEMFEEMKEKLPLEELLDNFEVSNSEDEEDKIRPDDYDSNDVKYHEIYSIGLEKMYSQFQDLNQNLKSKMDLQSKIEINPNPQKKNGRRERNRMTFVDNTKRLKSDTRPDLPMNTDYLNPSKNSRTDLLLGLPANSRQKRKNTVTGKGGTPGLGVNEDQSKLITELAKHAEAINDKMNDLLKRSEKLNENAKKLSGQIDTILRD